MLKTSIAFFHRPKDLLLTILRVYPVLGVVTAKIHPKGVPAKRQWCYVFKP